MSSQAPSAAAEVGSEQQKITAEIRELDLLIESTQTEVSRLKAREEQTKGRVEEARGNPAGFGREQIFAATDAMAPWANGRQYLNFAESAIDASAGYRADVWARLTAIRAQWDPTGVFRANHEVPPAGRR